MGYNSATNKNENSLILNFVESAKIVSYVISLYEIHLTQESSLSFIFVIQNYDNRIISI